LSGRLQVDSTPLAQVVVRRKAEWPASEIKL
jgi:hypothetical protein